MLIKKKFLKIVLNHLKRIVVEISNSITMAWQPSHIAVVIKYFKRLQY